MVLKCILKKNYINRTLKRALPGTYFSDDFGCWKFTNGGGGKWKLKAADKFHDGNGRIILTVYIDNFDIKEQPIVRKNIEKLSEEILEN